MWCIALQSFGVPGSFSMRKGEKRQIPTELAQDLIRAGFVEPTKGAIKQTAESKQAGGREKQIVE